MFKIFLFCFGLNFAWNMFGIQCVKHHHKLTGVKISTTLMEEIQVATVVPSFGILGLFIVLSFGLFIIRSFK